MNLVPYHQANGCRQSHKWAHYPAEAHVADFQQKFDLLTEFPEIGPKRDYLAPGLRALRVVEEGAAGA